MSSPGSHQSSSSRLSFTMDGHRVLIVELEEDKNGAPRYMIFFPAIYEVSLLRSCIFLAFDESHGSFV